jgi:2-polyprenyl-3-methyl-5-hydroxy-6-metoxy-1,4-benzoquinol methylase
MDIFKDELYPGDIIDMVFAFQKSRVVLTAYELDIFTALGDEEKSAREVSKTAGSNERATDRLMSALCALGLMKKNGVKYANTPLTTRFLVKGKPDFASGLMHLVHLWESWGTLSEAVRQGTSVLHRPADERGEKWLQAFIAAMHDRAYRTAPAVVELLDLSEVSRVLDIGGGSGAYSMAFVRAREEIRATVIDLPAVIPLTRKYIEREGLSDRIETRSGDYNADELGNNFDLIFMSAIIHSNSFDENRELIKKCFRALNANGQLIIQDFIMDEDRTSPVFGALFALNMLVGTRSGDTYTEGEVRAWMNDIGLKDIKRRDTDFGTSLIIGRKE